MIAALLVSRGISTPWAAPQPFMGRIPDDQGSVMIDQEYHLSTDSLTSMMPPSPQFLCLQETTIVSCSAAPGAGLSCRPIGRWRSNSGHMNSTNSFVMVLPSGGAWPSMNGKHPSLSKIHKSAYPLYNVEQNWSSFSTFFDDCLDENGGRPFFAIEINPITETTPYQMQYQISNRGESPFIKVSRPMCHVAFGLVISSSEKYSLQQKHWYIWSSLWLP